MISVIFNLSFLPDEELHRDRVEKVLDHLEQDGCRDQHGRVSLARSYRIRLRPQRCESPVILLRNSVGD